jgi:hypothetical protein
VTRRTTLSFAALIAVQAAHSIEEYAGRLWESFPPAAFVSSIVPSNHELGFILVNFALVAFGLWCLVGPIRHNAKHAIALMWIWIVIELINGIGHPLWSLRQGGYTPGLLTAPLLLLLALNLVFQLRRDRREEL